MLRIQSVIAKVVNFKILVTFCFIISTNLLLESQLSYKNLMESSSIVVGVCYCANVRVGVYYPCSK